MTSEKEILEEHLNIMVESLKALSSAFNGWCDSKDVTKDAEKVIELEKKGDRIHEKFSEYLFSGGAVHFSKADKLVLSDKIDKILNVAEIAAQKLLVVPKTLKVKTSCQADVKSLAEIVVITAELLKQCINAVNVDFDQAIKLAEKVEDARRDARNLEWKILKLLLDGQIDVNTLLIKELIELLVMVADKAEALSDYVDFLAIRYKSIL